MKVGSMSMIAACMGNKNGVQGVVTLSKYSFTEISMIT